MDGIFRQAGPGARRGRGAFAPNSRPLGKGGASRASGYSIVAADTLDKAIVMTEGHPHLAHGGGIEVFELAKVPGM